MLQIIGAVCLLLWGTQMVRRGFTKAYGESLNRILDRGTRSRPRAFLSGFIVTGLLQSSTATILLLISFAKRGLIPLAAAVAVVIGADISTTLVTQILSFDLSWLSPALIIIGYIIDKTSPKEGRRKYTARIFLGIGFMLLALTLIRKAAAPISASETLPLILAPLNSDPVLAILFAALITWVIHSSLASVLLFSTLAASGVIALPLGILMVLGANFGGALVPLAATWGDGYQARQITFANLLMRGATILLILPFIHFVPDLLAKTTLDSARQLINMHMFFNMLLAIIFMPVIGFLTKPCEALFKKEDDIDKSVQPLYLDERSIDSPPIAITAAARETLHIAEIVEAMLRDAMPAIEEDNSAVIRRIRNADNDVDRLYKDIKLYIARISQDGMDFKEASRSIRVLTFATNLEHIGDIIDKSLMNLAVKHHEKQNHFSDEGLQEIKAFHAHVLKNLKLAQTIFMSDNKELAQKLIDDKELIRKEAEASNDAHFKRLQKGNSKTVATSAVHLDIIRDLRRINSYITRVAYAVLEG